jgi:hypothetical protein
MCLERLACFSTSCRVRLGRPFMPYCNIFGHINWSKMESKDFHCVGHVWRTYNIDMVAGD